MNNMYNNDEMSTSKYTLYEIVFVVLIFVDIALYFAGVNMLFVLIVAFTLLILGVTVIVADWGEYKHEVQKASKK